jgi:hypothetical protein
MIHTHTISATMPLLQVISMENEVFECFFNLIEDLFLFIEFYEIKNHLFLKTIVLSVSRQSREHDLKKM